MGKRLLVFGGTGFVGGHIAQRAYDAGWQVTAAASRAAPSPGPVASRPVDVGDPWAVRGAVEDLRPDVVVNAAALADVDRAEREPDLAWRVNAEGARNVAQACQDFSARCIYYSTDVVFDGTAQAYREDDPMGPINAYGKSKAEGERLTLATCPGAAIIRVSLVLGFPLGQGNAYLPKLRERLLAGQPAPSPADEIRTPVDVHTAVAATLELASSDFAGRLHIGATQAVDRYTLAQRVASAMGLNPSLVLPHAVYPTGEEAVVRAARHKRGVLDVTRAQQVLATPMLSAGRDDLPRLERDAAMTSYPVKHELEVAFGTIYGPEEDAAVLDVLRHGAPSCGQKVKQFEEAFAAYCGTPFALAVTSATTGLTLAGIAANVQPGDEVITTPISWVATAMAFSALGARILFCDVDPGTLNLDPNRLEALITQRTRAIVPVHLYGQCCEMDAITAIAARHGVAVIEDCAHNPGGAWCGVKSGAWGDLGVFSFHQQKNMSTLGEGGMVTTRSRDLRDRVLSYRSLCARTYGQSHKYLSIDESQHPMNREYWRLQFDDIGFNYRMTDVQAAAGLAQLVKLDGFNATRRTIADRLTERLRDLPSLALPTVDTRGEHVFHVYVIQLGDGFPMSKRDFMWALYTEYGIKAWSHYMPIHLTDPYRAQGHTEGECPVAEAALNRYVSLPVHPRLTDEAVDYMADAVRTLSLS